MEKQEVILPTLKSEDAFFRVDHRVTVSDLDDCNVCAWKDDVGVCLDTHETEATEVFNKAQEALWKLLIPLKDLSDTDYQYVSKMSLIEEAKVK